MWNVTRKKIANVVFKNHVLKKSVKIQKVLYDVPMPVFSDMILHLKYSSFDCGILIMKLLVTGK